MSFIESSTVARQEYYSGQKLSLEAGILKLAHFRYLIIVLERIIPFRLAVGESPDAFQLEFPLVERCNGFWRESGCYNIYLHAWKNASQPSNHPLTHSSAV